MNRRQGTWETNLQGRLKYQSFYPAPLPPSPPIEITTAIRQALIEAHTAIAVLNVRSGLLSDYRLFISMMLYKESLLSSQIEGTIATLEDVFGTDNHDHVSLGVSDVLHYIDALTFARARLETLPFSTRLLKEVHGRLLDSQYDKAKEPGLFRQTQNWIGSKGLSLQEAGFIPPNVETMHQCLNDLEQFMHTKDDLDPLIKLGLMHYQFETIHPFLDGNGRMGRILLIIMMQEKGLIEEPSLPLSYHLKRHRAEYYDRLRAVQQFGHYEEWVLFFLKTVSESAIHAATVIDEIQFMIAIHKQQILQSDYRNKENMISLYEDLLQHPVTTITNAASRCGFTYNTVRSIYRAFQDFGYLVLQSNQKRNKSYVFTQYIDILKEGT